jgi:hypothetical protein
MFRQLPARASAAGRLVVLGLAHNRPASDPSDARSWRTFMAEFNFDFSLVEIGRDRSNVRRCPLLVRSDAQTAIVRTPNKIRRQPSN